MVDYQFSDLRGRLANDIAAAFTSLAAIPETELRRNEAKAFRDLLAEAVQGLEDTFVDPPNALKILNPSSA